MIRVVIDPGVKNLCILRYDTGSGFIKGCDVFSFASSHDNLATVTKKFVTFLLEMFGEAQGVSSVVVEKQMYNAPRNLTLQTVIITFFESRGVTVRTVSAKEKFINLCDPSHPFSDAVIVKWILEEEQRKRWKQLSIKIVERILAREETERFIVLCDRLERADKKDDLCDVFLMLITTAA